jgi:hypothetical protein
MFYRGPSFPAVLRICSYLAPSTTSPSSQQVFSISQSCYISQGGAGGGGAKPYNGEKAWYSINHSKLSGLQLTCGHILNGKTTVSSRLFASCYLSIYEKNKY